MKSGKLETTSSLGRRRRLSRGLSRQLGRRTSCRQCGANRALALVEPFPDALQGSVTQMTLGGANRGGDTVGDGALEELPQGVGSQAQQSDFVSAPDAESPPAAVTSIAVAAKDTSSTHGFSLGISVVVAAQIAVPNERANDLAMRTMRLLESLGKRVPFVAAAAKPPLFAHDWPMPHKNDQFYRPAEVRGRGGVCAAPLALDQ